MNGISLGRVTILLLLCRAGGYVLALVNSIILARALGAERLGAYAYAMGLAALFGLLPNFGLNTVVTRAVAQQPDTWIAVLRAAVHAQAWLAGIALAAIPAFAAMLPAQPVPIGYVVLAALQMTIGILSWPYLAVLAGHSRFDRVATIELVAGVLGTAALLGAVALQGGVVAVLSAHVLASVGAVLMAKRVAQPFLGSGRTPPIGIIAILKQAAPFGAVAAAQSLYTRVDILLLGQMASTVAVGLYSVAYKPTNMIVYLGGTIAVTLFPLMAVAPRAGTPIPFQRAMRWLGSVGPAVALTLSGLAGPVLQLLYGVEYVAAAPILAVLAWSVVANWLYMPLGTALQARGQERWWLASMVGALLLNGAVNFWAIPRWGGIGAAVATLVSEAALLAAGVLLVGRSLGMVSPLRPIAIGFGATVSSGAVLWVLQGEGTLAGTATALAVYVGFLIGCKGITADDARFVFGLFRSGSVSAMNIEAAGPSRTERV